MTKTATAEKFTDEAPVPASAPSEAGEKVTMQDGRVVEFKGKRKLLKESFFHEGHPHTRLDFRNGETRTFRIPEALVHRFAMHGAEQKLGDAIAGLDNIDDGVLAVDELIKRLSTGEEGAWAAKREGDSMAGTSILAKALVEYTGKLPDAIKEFLSGKNQAEKVALRNSPQIKPIIEKLEAAKAGKGKSKVDTEALLDELS